MLRPARWRWRIKTDASGTARSVVQFSESRGVDIVSRALSRKASLSLVAFFAGACCFSGAAQQAVTVTLDPPRLSLEVGQSAAVRATARDASGNDLNGDVTWHSDNPAIVRVNGDGVVTATGLGLTGITARVGTNFGSAHVSVFPHAAARNTSVRPESPSSERPVEARTTALVSASQEGSSPRSPHFSHISVFYTDFYSSYASAQDRDATIKFLASRVDGIMSGPRDRWKSANPTIRYYPYALQYEVVQSEVGSSATHLTNSYVPDMIRWYAAHPTYDYESAFLHRGGHDSTHRVAFKNESNRWLINPGDAGSRAYQSDRLSRVAQGQDGVFLDEFGGPMYGAGKPSDEFANSAAYLASEAQMIAQIHAAISPRILLINIAEYWTPTDSAIVVAGGGAQLERTNYPLSDRTEERWTQIDHLLAAGVYTEFVSTLSYSEWANFTKSHPSFVGGMYHSTTDRAQMAQLASYYMAVPTDPQRFSFDQQNFWNVRPDTAWAAAVEVDVGHPLQARHIIARGLDPRGQSYRVYAREFEHAFVLMRPAIDWHPTVYGDDTGITVPLPTPMRLLHRDGTSGGPVTSVKLRNVDAAILLK
jgi:Bacterial Ig-like domain (group 2)